MTTPEQRDTGCQCLCLSTHPEHRDACTHTGQLIVTVQAARAGRTFPVRVPACLPCATLLEEVPNPV
ncbi:hypothetical protein ACIBF1_16030 [Spirillospora sp. NPDC050679]